MIMLACDLDNTIIFRKPNPLHDYVPAEYLDGKPLTYISRRALELFQNIDRHVEFVPVTARSMEEYARIAVFADRPPRYAITSLGGVILKDGKMDAEWEKRRDAIMRPVRETLGRVYLTFKGEGRASRIRMVDESYLFLKSDCAEDLEPEIRGLCEDSGLNILRRGKKIYITPMGINKETAALALREELAAKIMVAAGDSDSDIGMLNAADYALVPELDMLAGLKPRRGAFSTAGNDFASFVFGFLSGCDRQDKI